MALNVPLTQGHDGSFPLPFQGEVFLLTRDKTELTFRDSARQAKKLKGRLFMTNLRMVFLIREADQQRIGAQTFEIPFRGLWDEKLNQPIFGAIHLTGTVQYYDDQPFTGDLTMRLDFAEGGVGTFLNAFNNVLSVTRTQMAHERAHQQYAPPPIPPPQSTPTDTPFNHDQNTAFVDPQDPSRLYTTQPAVAEEQRRRDAPSWHPSAAGLRRR